MDTKRNCKQRTIPYDHNLNTMCSLIERLTWAHCVRNYIRCVHNRSFALYRIYRLRNKATRQVMHMFDGCWGKLFFDYKAMIKIHVFFFIKNLVVTTSHAHSLKPHNLNVVVVVHAMWLLRNVQIFIERFISMYCFSYLLLWTYLNGSYLVNSIYISMNIVFGIFGNCRPLALNRTTTSEVEDACICVHETMETCLWYQQVLHRNSEILAVLYYLNRLDNLNRTA